jgi:hypothetical protein
LILATALCEVYSAAGIVGCAKCDHGSTTAGFFGSNNFLNRRFPSWRNKDTPFMGLRPENPHTFDLIKAGAYGYFLNIFRAGWLR